MHSQKSTLELTFNARILQTEVLALQGTQSKSMINKLRRMARSETNKEYLDQVYYAMGNIYLAQRDTTAAITAYEQGRNKSKRNGIEKGVLLLRLGELYWDRQQFDKAQPCYTEAIGLIDKERTDYEDITRRSKVLDKLVPYTSAVHLQDSLQTLARMSEADRNAAIDRVIEALKRKKLRNVKQNATRQHKHVPTKMLKTRMAVVPTPLRTPLLKTTITKHGTFTTPCK